MGPNYGVFHRLWDFVDRSKLKLQLILTKNVDRKAQELGGEEKEKVIDEYEKKQDEWKIAHHQVIP